MSDYYSEYGVNVTANTNILSINFSSEYKKTDRSVVYIWVTPEAYGILSLIRVKDSTTYTEYLNSGFALEAGAAYMFPVMITEDEINLRYSVDTTFKYIQLREML